VVVFDDLMWCTRFNSEILIYTFPYLDMTLVSYLLSAD